MILPSGKLRVCELENHHLEWVNHGKSSVNEPFSIAM